MDLTKIALIILAAIYVLSPVDIIPDIGIVGRIDDLLLVLFLYSRFKNWKKVAGEDGDYQKRGDSARQERRATQEARSASPYEVLGVSRVASAEEIQSAYRKLVAQYHPDKVQHLGKELQELAHEKMLEIQSAYEALENVEKT